MAFALNENCVIRKLAWILQRILKEAKATLVT